MTNLLPVGRVRRALLIRGTSKNKTNPPEAKTVRLQKRGGRSSGGLKTGVPLYYLAAGNTLHMDSHLIFDASK